MLQIADVHYANETAAHDAAVEALADEAFGPGRFVRAAQRVREMAPHSLALSFVATIDDNVVGSVRQTPVRIGATPALLLGPLVVRRAHKGHGIGSALMGMASDAARVAGESVVLLVGDRAYYEGFGYRPVPPGSVRLPGPADPRRVLALALRDDGVLDGLSGSIRSR